MRILFLSTWFPYPLSQGSKIRAYYLLRALTQEHDVYLLSFADEPIKQEWVNHIGQLCSHVGVVQHNPFAYGRARAMLGRLSLLPLSIVASYSGEMASQICSTIRNWKPDRIVSLTFVTARYLDGERDIPKIGDMENVMTNLLREKYRSKDACTSRWRGWLAWRKFRRYERRLYSNFEQILAVSKKDQDTLIELMPAREEVIRLVPNGVDVKHNLPGLASPQPGSLIFNGALGYDPNYDAMAFFLHEIFPAVRDAMPQTTLRITGISDPAKAESLPSDGVSFTGYLDDIRPAVAGSWACVVPLRIGGGTRLKVLEAMALGTPVITTAKGAEGLEVIDGKHLLIADSADEFVARTIELLSSQSLRSELANNARILVEEKYSWEKIGQHFLSVVEQADIALH